MIPITVYLQTPEAAGGYRQLFRQQFYTVPTIGSMVRVYVTDRADVYVVREVYHDFRSGPQGPSPLPISIVVSEAETNAEPAAKPRAHSEIGGDWGNEFQSVPRESDIPRLS